MTYRIALFIVLIAAVAGGYYLLKKPKPVSVSIYTVAAGEVKTTVSNTRVGTVKPCRRAYLAPAAADKLIKLNVREGDAVKKNQILLEVWNDNLKAQVDLRKAEIRTSQSNAAQACHVADFAEREAARLRKLQKYKQIVSEEQVDQAVTDAMAKRSACVSARAGIAVSQAAMAVAEATLERTFLRAPFDGIVAEVNAELGEYVTPSPPGIPTPPSIDLLDLSCIYVSAPIDEVDAPLIETGMPACVSLDAFSGKRCSGTVTRIAPYVLEKEKQARTVEVEVKLTDPKELESLLPGYSADIEVLIENRENALRIPTEAVLEGNKVMVVGEKNVLEERSFRPGLSNWEFTEAVSGLKEGDRIVLSVGRDGVEAGAHVVEEKN
ncbi:MAG: efflux RND transporter periplasmic adaptor subunit [Gammaproteobacteria bacterium]